MLTDEQIIKLGVNLTKEHTKYAKWAAVVTFDRPSEDNRFFLINVDREEIDTRTHTTHGNKSGLISGNNLKFSNMVGSHMSSLGLMKCAEPYFSTKFEGWSLRLDGLEKGINNNVRRRAIVIHPSDYVSLSYLLRNKQPGRSQGCFAVGKHINKYLVDRLKGGSILFAVAPDNLEQALEIIEG